MKYIYCVFLFLFLASLGKSQVVAVGLDKMNILYIGIPNAITIAAEKFHCRDLIVTTDNGTITKEKDGHYTIVPDHPSMMDSIIIKAKTNKGTIKIGEGLFRVKYLPNQSYLASKTGGAMSATLAHWSGGPSSNQEGKARDTRIFVDSFTVVITRDEKEIFRKTVTNQHEGAQFSDDAATRAAINALQAGDKLKIINITYKCYSNNCKGSLKPMDFTITE